MIEVKRNLSTVKHLVVAALVIVVLSLVMTALLFWQGVLTRRTITSVSQAAIGNTAEIAKIRANQDLYRQQYLNYIQDMIEAMNQLQESNPHLKVPKAPVPRPVTEKISESDLRRLPQPGPAPTPVVKTEVKTKKVYIKVKPKPTPSAIKRFFNPKSTR